MERALTRPPGTRALSARWSSDLGSVAAWLLPVALVSYLGMRSGGYDSLISDQVAIALWWIIFLALAAGLVRLRLSTPARIGLGLLAAYGAWTAMSLIWTESAARTMGDVTLMLLYVALAILAFALRGRDAPRLMLGGLAVALAAIAVVALLSRLHFAWFAVPEVDLALPSYTHTLSYPIGYWNALAALMAMGIPALLYGATGARTLVLRALAGAGVPALVLCVYLTDSRAGAIAVVLAAVVFIVLAPGRPAKLAVMLVCAAGSALLAGAADQRPAVRDGLRTPLAAHQGNELLAIVIAVAVGVGLLVYAAALIERHVERPRVLALSRERFTRLSALALVVAIAVFIAAGGVGFAHREWRQFKTPGTAASVGGGSGVARLSDASGNGRYQYWQSAVRAADAHPLTGTGAGTFIYWWARDGVPSGGYVQDAHSLYLQALGELGYPGLILIVTLVLWILGAGVGRAIRARAPDHRLALAAATATAAVFAFSAAFEWIWLIPVLPATLLVAAAVIFYPHAEGGRPRRGARWKRWMGGSLSRLSARREARMAAIAAAALASLAAMVIVALPMAATAADRRSEAQARAGELSASLRSAATAVRLTPYAAPAWLQEALVLELAGNLPAALTDAQRATAREPDNWQNWLVLSRLQARTGHAGAALADYLRARSLDPYNPIFSR
jgi:O-antigen ligase